MTLAEIIEALRRAGYSDDEIRRALCESVAAKMEQDAAKFRREAERWIRGS